MSLDIINVLISEQAITVTDSPHSVGAITATPLRRAVSFTWPAEDIAPWFYEFETQVETDGWSAATRIIGNVVVRELTAAEQAAGKNTITCRVRTNDADDNTSSWATSSPTDVLPIDIGVGEASGILPSQLDATTTARMFTTSGKLGSELGALSVAAAQLAADSVTTTKLLNLSVTTEKLNDLAVTEEKINSLAVTEEKIGALAVTTEKIGLLAVDSAQIAANAITNTKILDATVDVAKLAASSTARMFGSGGVAKLDLAFPVTVNNLDTTDRIGIIIGANKNLVANKTSIKGDLDLGNVQNYSATNQVTQGLSDTNLVSNTAAVISEGSVKNQTVHVAFNAATTGVKASKLKDDTLAVSVFDSSGRVLTGIYGSAARTAAAIQASMDSSGNSQHLDLTSLKIGQSYDDLPDGTSYKKVTANQQLGAGYAYIGLDSAGKQKIGVVDSGITITASQIRQNHVTSRILASRGIVSATAASFASISHTGTGAEVCIYKQKFIRQTSDNQLYISFNLTNKGDSALVSRIDVYDDKDSVPLAAGSASSAYASTGWKDEKITMPVIGLLADDTVYTLRFYITGSYGSGYAIEDSFVVRMLMA